MNPQIKKFLSEIGAKGGRKSKRIITATQQKKMQLGRKRKSKSSGLTSRKPKGAGNGTDQPPNAMTTKPESDTPDENQEAYEDFCYDPYCKRCNVPMQLNDGCEWPKDPRLWLCGSCASNRLEETLASLTTTRAQLAETVGVLQRCADALARCYDVTDFPADNICDQATALAAASAHLQSLEGKDTTP